MEPALKPGTVFAERYRLVRPLARGGMGAVWRAEHLALGSEVAVKIIDPAVARLELGLPRFLREARALATLHSPYIVQVIDFGTHEELAFLVMELLEGRTLGQRLKVEGKVAPAETHRIVGQVCRAMTHAHDRGIVHRDLKPDNIFLCDESREHLTKVLDFGIAKPTGLDSASSVDTGFGAFLGTPSYMSPEQCRGLKVDRRSDLWALGAITYECLTGKRLFSGDAVGDIVFRICASDLPTGELDALPRGFDAWLRRAMAHEPEARFQTAAELLVELGPVLDGAATTSQRLDSALTIPDAPAPAAHASVDVSTLASGSLERSARRSLERQRSPLGIAIGAALLIIAFAALALSQRRAPASGALPAAARSEDRSTPPLAATPTSAAPAGAASPDEVRPAPLGATEVASGGAPGVGAAASPPVVRDGPAAAGGASSTVKPAPRALERPKAPYKLDELRRTR